MIRYACGSCGARHAVTLQRFRCDCGVPLDLDFDPEPLAPDELARRPAGLWRYREVLPLGRRLELPSLGEGVCPLVPEQLGEVPVNLALEYVSPTGSFKDRGAALLVAVAVHLGAAELLDDSSGNAAIALAAYAARARRPARVLVPEDAPAMKPRIASRLGARVVRVPGGRSGAAEAAVREAEKGAFYASHAWSPFFLHGTKTAAYGLMESLRGEMPGAVLVPVGNGSLLLGLALGFREMRRAGTIARRPALVGIQAAACAPLARAFAEGWEVPAPAPEGCTAAEGVRVGAPPRGAAVLVAVRESGGTVEQVNEEEIAAAAETLWRRGYLVESTAALGAALVLREGGALRRRYGDLVVLLTGSGLKTG